MDTSAGQRRCCPSYAYSAGAYRHGSVPRDTGERLAVSWRSTLSSRGSARAWAGEAHPGSPPTTSVAAPGHAVLRRQAGCGAFAAFRRLAEGFPDPE